MEDGAQWVVGGTLIVFGMLVVWLGWRGAARHLATLRVARTSRRSVSAAATGTRRAPETSTRPVWWSPALLLPVGGVAVAVMGLLFGLGFDELALAVLYVLAGISVVAIVVGAMRAWRAGNRRQAAFSVGLAVYLVVTFTSILLGPELLTQLLLAASAAVLLGTGVWVAIRRWSGADRLRRLELVQQVLLGLGISALAAAQLLPRQLHALGLVLALISVAFMITSLVLNRSGRRQRRAEAQAPPTP